METARERYEAWLNSPAVDAASREELLSLQDNEKEIEERFYQNLEFGTGGLRGIMGAGTNRMNVYTVRRATQGLVNYLLAHTEGAREKGIAIAYDSRHNSRLFAKETAAVANGNGMKAYVFESVRPTPELSFAIRHLGCASGVVVTASHNPSQYNGYKAYWDDGCQVPPPIDEEIIDEVEKVDLFSGVKTMPEEQARREGLYIEIGEEVDAAFTKAVCGAVIDPDMVREHGKDLCIVYTPLHGTGKKPMLRALKEAGFTNVHVVPSQAEPDGDFPTASYPNPEDPGVFAKGIELADEVGGDIIIATDPDADRMGMMVRTKDGFRHFTGNMTGSLLLSYILEARKKTGNLPAGSFAVKTVVSTELVRAISEKYGIELREVLTGFKYIGQEIVGSEKTGKGTYVFGFEESFGYLCGTFARDKDSVSSALIACEMAALYKTKGQTLEDALSELYEAYGYYEEKTVSLTFEGIEGAEKIRGLMDTLRKNPKESYAGKRVLSVKDYAAGIDGLPKSNVLRFLLEDHGWFCARPSGTEPKIKFYFGVHSHSAEEARALLEKLQTEVIPS